MTVSRLLQTKWQYVYAKPNAFYAPQNTDKNLNELKKHIVRQIENLQSVSHLCDR